ncbi:hypothetical protein RDI58_004762 [Solanum bulbocastanum]|uniref:Uncharacterized protein n=1 Tax=Solanum bulbocastanum TaxID=147425 RepID=A0AAN8U6H6_SOLBU
MLLLLFVKLNSDGRCRDGICGGGGVVRDSMGALIMALLHSLGCWNQQLGRSKGSVKVGFMKARKEAKLTSTKPCDLSSFTYPTGISLMPCLLVSPKFT